MEQYARLTRREVIARLRELAAQDGFVSSQSLLDGDRVLLRSIPLYFAGLDAARHAASVSPPPYSHSGAKRGPKPGTKRGPRRALWSRSRVLSELRALDRSGRSTGLDALFGAGLVPLVRAATLHFGGLAKARAKARVPPPPRRTTKRNHWSRTRVLAALRARRQKKQSLAASVVPQELYRAARWHFGNWVAALEALGVDARAERKVRYTRAEVIARLRQAARDGSDLKAESLKRVVDLKSLRREFGTIAKAVNAAGLDAELARRRHGNTKWTRARVIEVLRERAARGEHTLTPGLYRVAQLYCGGTEHARVAAGVPSPIDLQREAQRRRKGTEDRRARPMLKSRGRSR